MGVHNTEYEVMSEDPGSTIHTLMKTASTPVPGKLSVRPSEVSTGAADTKRPFADSDGAGRASSASTMSGSTAISSQSGADPQEQGTPMRGVPSANTTAAAYLSAVTKSGLASSPMNNTAASPGTRHSTGAARLSRLSLGIEGGKHSFASNSVAHSQDTDNQGDLGFARKLEVR